MNFGKVVGMIDGDDIDIMESIFNVKSNRCTILKVLENKSNKVEKGNIENNDKSVGYKSQSGVGHKEMGSGPISSFPVDHRNMGCKGGHVLVRTRKKKSIKTILGSLKNQSIPSYFNILMPNKDRGCAGGSSNPKPNFKPNLAIFGFSEKFFF